MIANLPILFIGKILSGITPKWQHLTSKIDKGSDQRPYRKDRLPRAYFCYRQLAKFRIVQGICLYNMLHWLVCYKPAGQSFPDFGVWVSVDFDSKYKIVWGETREEIKKKLEKKST